MAVIQAMQRAAWAFEDFSEVHPNVGAAVAIALMLAAFGLAGGIETGSIW